MADPAEQEDAMRGLGPWRCRLGRREQPLVECGRDHVGGRERLRGHDVLELLTVAAADADDGVCELGYPPLQTQHHGAQRCRHAAQHALEHPAGDVVVADDDGTPATAEEELGPGGIVAVEVEDVAVAELAPVRPEPAPEAQIVAAEVGAFGDVGDVGHLARLLQLGRHQTEGQLGAEQSSMQPAEMLGTAAEIIGERVVVVEDIDYGRAPAGAGRQCLEPIMSAITIPALAAFSTMGSPKRRASRR
jgi:hypothetical protein